jgi:hypothetical protein
VAGTGLAAIERGKRMRKHLAVAAATFALTTAGALATSANATTFTGSYTAAGNTNSNTGGLQITLADQTPGAGQGFSFNLTSINQSATLNLFNISSPEDQVNGDDTTPKPISVVFSFTAPSVKTGTVNGDTDGEIVQVTANSYYQAGVLTWDNNGDTTVNFGGAGSLLIHLNDVVFDKGANYNPRYDDDDVGLGNTPGLVKAVFTLKAGAVPEPASWAMMIVGFFGLGAMLRATRRQTLAA